MRTTSTKVSKLAAIVSLTMLLGPLSVLAADQPGPKSPAPSATPLWTLNQPAMCSAEGPPPCEKCTVTCPPEKRPHCMPGDTAPAGQPPACVHPTVCRCE